MITELHLENFKGIKKGSLNLDKLTILLGANNSGKTTILESLYLLPNPFRRTSYLVPEVGSRVIQVIHSLHKTLESQGYSFLLHNYSAEAAQIRVMDGFSERILNFLVLDSGVSIGLESPDIGSGLPFTHNGEQHMGIGFLSKGSNRVNPVNDHELIINNSLLISQSLINYGFEFMQQNWASIMNKGIGTKVAEAASKLSNDTYSDITLEPFLEGRSSINAYFNDGKRIRLGDLGEGIQNFIVAKMLYEIEQPQLLLWDDLGAHMNPRMIANIADWMTDLIDSGIQIITTTHSLDMVKIFSGIIDNTKIVLMNVQNGILESKEMTNDDIEIMDKKGIDPRVSERFLL